MRKIAVILILAVFLSSIGIVFAKEGKGEEAAEGNTPQAGEDYASKCIQGLLEKRTGVERAQTRCQNELNKLKEFSILHQNRYFLKYKENLSFKARAINNTVLERERANFLRSKEDFLDARRGYVDAQLKFLGMKNKATGCKGIETAECNQTREDIVGYAKEFLLNTTNLILMHLEKVKKKIEINEDLSAEEVSEIMRDIDKNIILIEDTKDIIESSESKEETVEAARLIKVSWAKIKKKTSIHVGETINSRIGGIIIKSKQLEAKLEKLLTRMEGKGQDSSNIEPLMEDFSANLEEAKNNYGLASEKFEEAKDDKTAYAELIKEAQNYMQNAKNALQEAQKNLRDIVLAIKKAGGQEELRKIEEEGIEEVEIEGGELNE